MNRSFFDDYLFYLMRGLRFLCQCCHTCNEIGKKIEVVQYTFMLRGVPVREETHPEQLTCGVGWPVPFLADFTSPVLPPGTHLLLGEQ